MGPEVLLVQASTSTSISTPIAMLVAASSCRIKIINLNQFVWLSSAGTGADKFTYAPEWARVGCDLLSIEINE